MALTAAEKQRAYRARAKVAAGDLIVGASPTGEVHASVVGSEPVGPIDRVAAGDLRALIERLHSQRKITTMVRRELLDALGVA